MWEPMNPAPPVTRTLFTAEGTTGKKYGILKGGCARLDPKCRNRSNYLANIEIGLVRGNAEALTDRVLSA